MKVELISYTNNPANTINEAASTCYDSAGSNLILKCYKSGHTSVLEHASFTFKISGISRACSHQLVRQRIASFSQRSQRYCTENNFEFVTPDSIAQNPIVLQRYNSLMEKVREFYKFAVDSGVSAEDARFILPNACNTEITMTLNIRSLMNFCNERLCTRAQWEIRKLAQLMRDEVIKVMPEAKTILVPKCEKYGDYAFCTEHRGCGRHPYLRDVYAM